MSVFLRGSSRTGQSTQTPTSAKVDHAWRAANDETDAPAGDAGEMPSDWFLSACSWLVSIWTAPPSSLYDLFILNFCLKLLQLLAFAVTACLHMSRFNIRGLSHPSKQRLGKHGATFPRISTPLHRHVRGHPEIRARWD